MWVLYIRCFDSNFKQEYRTYLIDVFYLTVKSASPMCKIRLGSVQEPENVVSSIMAKSCCFWRENHHLRFLIFRFTLKVLHGSLLVA